MVKNQLPTFLFHEFYTKSLSSCGKYCPVVSPIPIGDTTNGGILIHLYGEISCDHE